MMTGLDMNVTLGNDTLEGQRKGGSWGSLHDLSGDWLPRTESQDKGMGLFAHVHKGH